MHLPAPIVEHPIESAIAGLLLAALLLISADPDPGAAPVPRAPQALAQKM